MVFIFKKIDEWCVSKKTDTLIEEVTKSFLISVLIRNISVLFPKNTQEKALIQLLCVLHNMQNIVVLYRDVCSMYLETEFFFQQKNPPNPNL